MPTKARKRNTVTPSAKRTVTPVPRQPDGRFLPGFSGQPGGDAGRARKALNLATIREMHLAFQRGGRKAIDKVMVNAPAQFLKMLVLLVPRELEVTHSGGVKQMSDEDLERGIEALELILSKRAAKPGDDAKVIEGKAIEAEAKTVADTSSATND